MPLELDILPQTYKAGSILTGSIRWRLNKTEAAKAHQLRLIFLGNEYVMRTSTGHQLTSNDLFHMEKSVWRRGKVLVQDQINFTFSLHWPTATLPPSTTVTSHSMSYSTRYTVFVILQTLEGVTLDQQTKYLEYSPIKPELHPDPYLFWLYEKRCTFVQVKIPSTHFSVGQQILIQVKIDPYHQGRKLVSIAFKLIQTQEWACTGHSASRVLSEGTFVNREESVYLNIPDKSVPTFQSDLISVKYEVVVEFEYRRLFLKNKRYTRTMPIHVVPRILRKRYSAQPAIHCGQHQKPAWMELQRNSKV